MKTKYSTLCNAGRHIFFFIFLINIFSCQISQKEIPLTAGLKITQSTKIKSETYQLNGTENLKEGVILIEGENLVIDFQGATLQGSNDMDFANEFYGTGILVKGKNIEIKNLKVKGFKIGLLAEEVEGLKILDADFSYNFRQRLKSTPQKENLDDWLYYHNNENEEWFRYGAAIYLKKCHHALVKNTKVTQGQNGLMLVECDYGTFYNNDFSYNSGLGIGMYRSSFNRVMHNRCDWNIRGYSHGIYNRGQDSSGILAYESCHNNIFAYNSATHSGDGFFLWAGQEFMDTGKGGCNDNMIFGNDFSHASNNAIEVTFSSNMIINNRLEDSNYGVWGGYSYQTQIIDNQFSMNDKSIAFEHGFQNEILYNIFKNEKTGIQLWQRDKQPESWGFAKTNLNPSAEYFIRHNTFTNVKTPFKIQKTKDLNIQQNNISGFEKLLLEESPNGSFIFAKNRIYQKRGLGAAARFFRRGNILENQLLSQDDFATERAGAFRSPEVDSLYIYSSNIPLKKYDPSAPNPNKKIEVPAPLPDGMDAMLPENHRRGRKFMIVNEWGPYNFEYPLIWLQEVKNNIYTFSIFGNEGNWKIMGGEGFTKTSQQSGSVPSTLVVTGDRNANGKILIDLEFIGTPFEDQFGKQHPQGKPYLFSFEN